jgi:DNA-directed RNA polymerase subunit K/omega
MRQLEKQTGNIYEAISIVAKRANQIGLNVKEELNSKLSEFATSSDNLEEIFENREQIEISRHYERQPKPTLVAINEFLEGKVYHRKPTAEGSETAEQQ